MLPLLSGSYICSVKLQVKALRMIAGVAFFVLSRFPKTLEQDKQLLAGHAGQPLPDDLALAVQLRAGKKQLIAELLHNLATRIKVYFQVEFEASGNHVMWKLLLSHLKGLADGH